MLILHCSLQFWLLDTDRWDQEESISSESSWGVGSESSSDNFPVWCAVFIEPRPGMQQYLDIVRMNVRFHQNLKSEQLGLARHIAMLMLWEQLPAISFFAELPHNTFFCKSHNFGRRLLIQKRQPSHHWLYPHSISLQYQFVVYNDRYYPLAYPSP